MEPFLLILGGLVAALTFAAVALSGRKALFWVGLLVTLVPVEFVDRYYIDLPSSIKWLPELGLVAAAVGTLYLSPGSRPRAPTAVFVAYGATLLLCIVSWFLNGTSLVSLIISQRGYILLFATLITLEGVRPFYSKRDVLAILTGATVVSGFVNLLQRATLAPGEADRVTGLYSLGEVMAFFHLLGVGIAAIYALEGKRLLRWNSGAVVGLLVLSLAVSNQEAAIPYLGMLFGFLLLRSKRNRGLLLASAAVLGGLMLATFTFFWNADYAEEGDRSFSDSIFDWSYISRYVFGVEGVELTPGGDLLRGVAVRYAYQEIAEDPLTLAVGVGPGATSDSSIAGATGELSEKYPGIGRVTLSTLLGDTGLLGVVTYLAFLLALLRGHRARGDLEPREERLVRELFVLLTAGFFLYGRMQFEPTYAWTAAVMLYLAGRPGSEGDSAPEVPSPKSST